MKEQENNKRRFACPIETAALLTMNFLNKKIQAKYKWLELFEPVHKSWVNFNYEWVRIQIPAPKEGSFPIGKLRYFTKASAFGAIAYKLLIIWINSNSGIQIL